MSDHPVFPSRSFADGDELPRALPEPWPQERRPLAFIRRSWVDARRNTPGSVVGRDDADPVERAVDGDRRAA
jgi:hypothetical protein